MNCKSFHLHMFLRLLGEMSLYDKSLDIDNAKTGNNEGMISKDAIK